MDECSTSSSTTGNDPELATLTTSYSYNADRQQTTDQVPEGTAYQTLTKGYDTFGRLSTAFDPLSNVTASYEYVLNASGVSTDQVARIAHDPAPTHPRTLHPPWSIGGLYDTQDLSAGRHRCPVRSSAVGCQKSPS
jgi:hypothetical protein